MFATDPNVSRSAGQGVESGRGIDEAAPGLSLIDFFPNLLLSYLVFNFLLFSAEIKADPPHSRPSRG